MTHKLRTAALKASPTFVGVSSSELDPEADGRKRTEKGRLGQDTYQYTHPCLRSAHGKLSIRHTLQIMVTGGGTNAYQSSPIIWGGLLLFPCWRKSSSKRVSASRWKSTTFVTSGKAKGMQLGHCPPVTKSRATNCFPSLDVARSHLFRYYIFVTELSNWHTTVPPWIHRDIEMLNPFAVTWDLAQCNWVSVTLAVSSLGTTAELLRLSV